MTPFDLKTSNILLFKNKLSASQFTRAITESFSLKWGKENKRTVTFFDSFDGRLLHAGYTLALDDHLLILKSADKKSKDYTINWPIQRFPRIAKDFTDPEIQLLINKILDVRSITKTLSLQITEKVFDILNAELKIIARGMLLLANSKYPRANTNKTATLIQSLRGYAQDTKNIIKKLPDNQLHTDFGRAMLSAFDIDLKDYSKPVYNLAGKTKISEALFEILNANFSILIKNEQGIVGDIDIEFLHDYRVACRRMRSAVSLIKNVMDPVMRQLLELDLKFLGKFSGPLRDLDVYLLREDEYKALLPKSWPQKDIHLIFVSLKRHRQRAWKKMYTMIKSPEYKQLKERWAEFLSSYKRYVEHDAPMQATASALILKWFKRIIKDGKSLKSTDPDEKFHKLRITCKKLRYLLEFFGSLYPTEQINIAVKHLKKLQENLGEFNDYSIQIETLNQLLEDSRTKPLEFVKTIAGLISVLDYKMHRLRDEFYRLFEQFASVENTKLYQKLFGA